MYRTIHNVLIKLSRLSFNKAATLGAFVLIVLSMITSAGFIDVKHAVAAALLGVRSQPTSNIVTTKASYEILFTTATTGTIKTVTIEFPTGFDVGSVSLIERNGIGAGVLSASGTTLTYTVTSPVSIAAGIPIRFELSNIIHPGTPGAYSISITTKTSLGTTIDGPTVGSSSVVQIGTSAIANGAVTTQKLANGAVGPDQLGFGAVNELNVAPSFIVSTFLNDDANGHARGWNPSCQCTAHFDILDSSVFPTSTVLLTLTHDPAGIGPLCGVTNVGTGTFHVVCENPVANTGIPLRGESLIVTVINPLFEGP